MTTTDKDIDRLARQEYERRGGKYDAQGKPINASLFKLCQAGAAAYVTHYYSDAEASK